MLAQTQELEFNISLENTITWVFFNHVYLRFVVFSSSGFCLLCFAWKQELKMTLEFKNGMDNWIKVIYVLLKSTVSSRTISILGRSFDFGGYFERCLLSLSSRDRWHTIFKVVLHCHWSNGLDCAIGFACAVFLQ